MTWQLGPGERVGVVGVNGSGKTTLLQLLAGALPGALSATGRVVRGQTVRIGYLTQEPAAADPGCGCSKRPSRSAARSGSAAARCPPASCSTGSACAASGSGCRWPSCPAASGGGCSCMLVLLGEPNVLLLDEPTNELDIDTLTELEDMLDGWPGSMVVVSHDRYFLERACDHVVALVDGALPYLPGGVAEYLDRRARPPAARPPGPVGRRGPRRPAGPGPRAASRARPGSEPPRRSSAGWNASSTGYPARRPS